MLAHIRSALFDGCKIFSSDGSWKSLEKADSKVLCMPRIRGAARRRGGSLEEELGFVLCVGGLIKLG